MDKNLVPCFSDSRRSAFSALGIFALIRRYKFAFYYLLTGWLAVVVVGWPLVTVHVTGTETVVRGSEIRLVCKASPGSSRRVTDGGRRPRSVLWVKDGRRLTSEVRPRTAAEITRAAVRMAFQSPYPSHTHRNPHWNPHGNPHTYGTRSKYSITCRPTIPHRQILAVC